MNAGTYREHDVAGSIDRLLSECGLEGTLAGDDLGRIALLDQFHVGGSAAVDRVISPLGLGPDDRVLDVGSGFGGPARWVATRTGARVHGIDLVDEYVEAARLVTARADLGDTVTFEQVAVEQHHPAAPYDAAITMHVQMNVRDKREWFTAIGRLLRPGGSLGVWEIVATDDSTAPLVFPLPWSIDGTDSHLSNAEQLRSCIEESGFHTQEWNNEDVWVREWFDNVLGSGRPAGPSVGALIDDGPTRMANLLAAIRGGQLAVMRGSFKRSN
jgi:ubiquinone/menaquinone biosynthesis C-methylase UbiE